MLSARAYLLGILSWPCLRTSRRGRSSVRARDWITEGLRHCRSASGVDRGMDRANRPQQRQRPVASLAPTVTWAHWGGLAGGPMSLPAASACPPLAGTGGVWRAHVSFWPRTRWGPRTTCAPTAASDDAPLSAHQLLNSWLFHVEHLEPPCACLMRTPDAHDRPEQYPTRLPPDRPSGHVPRPVRFLPAAVDPIRWSLETVEPPGVEHQWTPPLPTHQALNASLFHVEHLEPSCA